MDHSCSGSDRADLDLGLVLQGFVGFLEDSEVARGLGRLAVLGLFRLISAYFSSHITLFNLPFEQYASYLLLCFRVAAAFEFGRVGVLYRQQ